MIENAAGIADLVRRRAQQSPDQAALIAGATRFSWAELDAGATRAALALLATGAQPGDRVTLCLPTGPDFVLVYLGALRAGLVVVPVHPAHTPIEIEHIRTDSGAALHLDVASAAALLASPPDGVDPGRDREGEAISLLLYTSGASARPKAAMLSARALLANLDQLAAVRPALLTAADVLLVPLPLTQVFGLNAGLGMALRVGATTVLVERFDAGETLRLMRAEQVSAVIGVPAQFAQWLAHPDVGVGFASVRLALSGSAPLPRPVAAGFARHGLILHDGYGLTETAPVVALTALTGGAGGPKPGSIGGPLPGVEVELRDADGDRLDSDDDPGRVFVRGPNLFSGYWPDGSGGPDEDGWFGTGDVAVRDDDGELYLVGRTSELVIVNGFNVYPAEVEAVLAAAPGVAEVAVVGVRDAQTGEAVRAYVVAAADARPDPAAVLAAAARSLARFKLPATIEYVSSLPRTVTGKVMKWRLSADALPEPATGPQPPSAGTGAPADGSA